MRHVVNFGLLFAFSTLAVSGALAFLQPFSIVTTRIHIVFGVSTAFLVGLHLVDRFKYFRAQLKGTGNNSVSRLSLALVVASWLGLLGVSFWNLPPVPSLVRQGYESSHRLEIVRNSAMAAFLDSKTSDGHLRLVAREPAPTADVRVAMTLQFAKNAQRPAVAVWAETTTGAMIETLYLDQAIAWAERPDWGGKETPRNQILPIWRHRYTMVSGIDPDGKVDTFTSATPTHSFSLDNYLSTSDAKSFILCVEVNAPSDPNSTYKDSHIGQPSLLYTALVEPSSQPGYVLLELTGHGGGSEKSGAIQYDLEGFTSAKSLVELLLARSVRTSQD